MAAKQGKNTVTIRAGSGSAIDQLSECKPAPPAASKQELYDFVELLSDYECNHLLRAMKDIAVGERFWEDDVGIFYNEYVKARFSSYSRNPAAFIGTEYAPIPVAKTYPAAEKVYLPDPDSLGMSLDEVLRSRRSRRECAKESLSLHQVATLLQYSYGTTGKVSAYGYNNIPLHTAPSSGALQAVEIYLFAQKVDGLQLGLYHYDSSERVVSLIKSGYHAPTMRAWVPGQPRAADAPVIFVLTGCYDRVRWKYGARSYRYMCMDIGFVCENMYLVAEAMGLAFCAVAGFIEDELEQYLQLDGQSEMTLLVASLGHRAT